MMSPLTPPGVSTSDLVKAVKVIQQGGVVAFPTETYYGLAVDPFNEVALARLFEIKKRPLGKAVLVLVNGKEQLLHLVQQVTPLFQPLMDKFWPGPLTLVFPALPLLSQFLTGGTGTIGVRLSSHIVAGCLLSCLDTPVTATSANLSGCEPAANAAQVEAQFGNAVDFILDGGQTPGGKGSTLVGCGDDGSCILLREGVIPFAQVESVVKMN